MTRFTLLFLSAILTFAQAPAVPPQQAQQPAQGDTKQRVRAVRDMAGKGQDAIPTIAPYLRDIDLSVRLETVKALDDIGGPKTVDALVEAARDNDPEMQIRATDGLVNVYMPGYLKTGITGTLSRAGNSIRQVLVRNGSGSYPAGRKSFVPNSFRNSPCTTAKPKSP